MERTRSAKNVLLTRESGVCFFEMDGTRIRDAGRGKLKSPAYVGNESEWQRDKTMLPLFWYLIFTGERQLPSPSDNAPLPKAPALIHRQRTPEMG